MRDFDRRCGALVVEAGEPPFFRRFFRAVGMRLAQPAPAEPKAEPGRSRRSPAAAGKLRTQRKAETGERRGILGLTLMRTGGREEPGNRPEGLLRRNRERPETGTRNGPVFVPAGLPPPACGLWRTRRRGRRGKSRMGAEMPGGEKPLKSSRSPFSPRNYRFLLRIVMASSTTFDRCMAIHAYRCLLS